MPEQTTNDYKDKSDSYWREHLTPEQYKVLRKEATEAPFTGIYDDHKENGMYHCAGCGSELFSSNTKYDAGCGWPSFWDVKDAKNVELKTDYKLIIPRTEVRCSVCGGHLGHVFEDGPNPTGKRYCINSAALGFDKKD